MPPIWHGKIRKLAIMTKKETRGGKRAGAGRKPKNTPKETVTLRLNVGVKDQIKLRYGTWAKAIETMLQ